MAHKKQAFDHTLQDLDLVPIMNMVVCLIPMILWGTSLVKLGVVNLSAPRFGPLPGESSPSLNLSVTFATDGFRLEATGEGFHEVVPEPFVPKKAGEYDWAALYNHLSTLKQRFPQETMLQLSAEPTLPYHTLITAMDTVRVQLEAERYPDVEALRRAGIKMDQGAQVPLWPDVVLAVVQ